MRNNIKGLIKGAVPSQLLRWYRRQKLSQSRRAFSFLSPREAFSKIYDENLWGGKPGEICSGSGSSLECARAYANAVKRFVAENEIETIVDLGCGDFTIGQAIQLPGTKYIGVDVVPRVVERNKRAFQQSNVEFRCLDIIEDDLPQADLCLIRQVLQHLSNAQIEAVLRKTDQFKWVIVTEHLPAPAATIQPNLDKPHGPDTRLVDGSGVFLEKPPFNRRVSKVLLDDPVASPLITGGERLHTLVFSNIRN